MGTKTPLTPIQAMNKMAEYEAQIRNLGLERASAIATRQAAKEELFAVLATARINSPEYEGPKAAMEEADKEIASIDRKVSFREAKIRELRPIARGYEAPLLAGATS